LSTEVSTIGEEIRVEEELVSFDITNNQREIREATSNSQKTINKLKYTRFDYQKDAKTTISNQRAVKSQIRSD